MKSSFLYKKIVQKKFWLKNNEKGLKNVAGRNNFGKITVWHKGTGHKKKYKKLNFLRIELSTGITCSIQYDPSRNANIAVIYDFLKNYFFYILAPKNLKIGDIIKTNNIVESRLGYSLPLQQIPIGSYIYNVSLQIKKIAKISRAAGTFCKLKKKELNYSIIELNSGVLKSISSQCFASIGMVSNEFFFLKKLTKAGQSWWLNKRPSVWGVAMNPVDHPNGGGEGKKSGRHKSPWGKFN